jgi:5-methylcytosine-specific restriction endonuclease McrA
VAKGLCNSHYSAMRRSQGQVRSKRGITCAHCGADHKTAQSSAKFCSVHCSKRAAAGWPPPSAWSTCTDLVHVPTTPKAPKVPTLPVVVKPSGGIFVNGACARCASQFTAWSTKGEARYCSLQCARAHGRDKRRAVKRNAYVADVNRRAIFERDGWQCQLCGDPVKRNAKVPDPKAPTIDHIVPLAAGGTHEPANAQCAHFLCNSRKGHRAANDQLRLIG